MLNLEFKLKPSRQYLSFLAVLILASIAIMLNLPIPIWVKLVGVLLIVSYGIFLFRYYGLLCSQHSIISLRHSSAGWLITTQKETYQAELLGDSTVSGIASVLRFRVDFTRQSIFNRPKTCVIFPDSLELELYRQLLVTVRMG